MKVMWCIAGFQPWSNLSPSASYFPMNSHSVGGKVCQSEYSCVCLCVCQSVTVENKPQNVCYLLIPSLSPYRQFYCQLRCALMWWQGGRATVHFSLHSDKRKGVGHIQKGPPTRLITLLRCHGPVSFASLTLRLYMKNLTFYSQQTHWSQFDVGRVPPWNSSKLLTESCWPKFSPFQIILFHLIYATKAFEKDKSLA